MVRTARFCFARSGPAVSDQVTETPNSRGQCRSWVKDGPALSQARSRSKGPLSDQVADAPNSRDQCRSWVGLSRWLGSRAVDELDRPRMASPGGFLTFAGTRSGDKVAPIPAVRGPRWNRWSRPSRAFLTAPADCRVGSEPDFRKCPLSADMKLRSADDIAKCYSRRGRPAANSCDGGVQSNGVGRALA